MRAAQAIALRGHTTKQVAPRKADRRGGGSITVRTTRESLRRTHSENGSKCRQAYITLRDQPPTRHSTDALPVSAPASPQQERQQRDAALLKLGGYSDAQHRWAYMRQATRTIPTGSALRDAITHIPFMPRWESRFTMIVPQALSHPVGISADATDLVRLATREHGEQAPRLTSHHKPQGDTCAHWTGCAEESRSCMTQRSRLMEILSATTTGGQPSPDGTGEQDTRTEVRGAQARSRDTSWRGHH